MKQESESMLAELKKRDPGLLELASGDGVVALSGLLQGRVFCSIDGELVHRFDSSCAASPSQEAFNNIGGNSLWPGPEGGPFAFNYLPGTGWLAQPDINLKPCEAFSRSSHCVEAVKDIALRNRKGVSVELRLLRQICPLDTGFLGKGRALKAVGYRSFDSLSPLRPHSLDEAIFCAWSLEQFPGGDGAVAFGRMEGAASEVNSDYYGDPGKRLLFRGGLFRLGLGGQERFQIGVRHGAKADLIGVYDGARGMLAVRRVWRQEGLYFNIADNEQPRGPFSAEDSFSIFNGGALGFYELEAIAPLQASADGRCGASLLWSETLIVKGGRAELADCLERCFGLSSEFIFGEGA